MLSELNNIIDQTSDTPTITNDKSKFVVCTYWWGRGNLNGNTARPCVSFYEPFFNGIRKQAIDILNTAYNENKKFVKTQFNNLESTLFKSTRYFTLVDKHVRVYMDDLHNSLNKPDNILKAIETRIKQGKMPVDYIYKEKKELHEIFKIIGILFLLVNKVNIFKIFVINNEMETLKMQYLNNAKKLSVPKDSNENEPITELTEKQIAGSNTTDQTPEKKEDSISKLEKAKQNKEKEKYEVNKKYYLDETKKLITKKNNIIAEIKKSLGTKQSYDVNKISDWFHIESKEMSIIKSKKNPIANIYLDDFQNKTIYEILNDNLRYLNPLKFEEMIAIWEEKCTKNGCNYLAIEYPQFAKPGGYQMAINAKPLFIKKALELCKDRGVLYIDGDMTINKYPSIFDMEDIDFMARGWNIDPRSSWRMEESITFDPYNFETSGGTMFFSQSKESKGLINAWINEAQKPYQIGKADDRILSLVFNTKGFLGSLKFIQLPIEYLWLTLDYDDRMMEFVYDYNKSIMDSTIFIEHPECLTTEDTAAGAGASSDRTPKFYNFLEDTIPVSETCFEKIIFDNAEQTSAFSHYFNYMESVTYKNDGNPELYERGLVVLKENGEVEYAEAPLHIVNYKNKFGKYNEISENNFAEANKMNENTSENSTEIVTVNDNIIPKIMFHLMNNRSVLYDPSHKPKYNPAYKKELLENPIYNNMSLVFLPSGNSTSHSDFFKSGMQLNQPIMFKPDRRLIDMLSIHESLESFSNTLKKGSYWFISLIRMGFITKSRNVKLNKKTGGSHKLKHKLMNKSRKSKYALMNKTRKSKYAFFNNTRKNKTLSLIEEQYRRGLQLLYGKA